MMTVTPPASADDSTQGARLHRQALTLARAGKFTPALAILEKLRARYPRRSEYLYDYIAVSGWAEHDDTVLHYLPQLNLLETPAYVLETLGKAARNKKRYLLAIDLYRRNFPDTRNVCRGHWVWRWRSRIWVKPKRPWPC